MRKMKKELSSGVQWTTHFQDEEGKKVYDRKEINEVITKFYEKLYQDKEALKYKQEHQEFESEPRF